MNTLTESQYKSLVNEIYDSLMGASIACECGESASFGMGEMGEVREQSQQIVTDWAEKSGITIEEDQPETTLVTNGFIVLSVLMGSYQPTFHEDEKLMFFATEQEAQTAIDECIADVKQAVIDGNMSDEYSHEDYKIIPAYLDGETITCIVDDERYTMQRSDDDFTRVAHPLAQ